MSIEEGITIKKLEVFLSFMNFGNMARVAEAMGQSTVSIHRALHSLEEAVRCPLFKRQGRNLIPLIAAYTFAEYARKILLACEEGLAKTREVGGFNAVTLKIGSLYSLTVSAIPQLLMGMKARRPELEINLSLGSNRELFRLLEDGRVDAIVVALTQDTHVEGMIALPLFYDSMYFAAPVDSPYASSASIDLEQLRHERFITLGEGFATSRDFAHAFLQAGFTPELVMHVDDIFSLINLVSGGVGYSLLPKRIETFSPRIHLIPLQERYVSRQLITVLIPDSRERDPNLLALAAECRLFSSRVKNAV
ncbi:LysR family malonate utilization transcriptional regulator [Oxalobacteraceae bacterium GrIS 2.11]